MRTIDFGKVTWSFDGLFDIAGGYEHPAHVRWNNSLYRTKQDVPPGITPDNVLYFELVIQGVPTSALTPFGKADLDSVGFLKTGAGSVSLKAGTVIELNGLIYEFASITPVAMPTLTPGTDYAIYLCEDGNLRADANFVAPAGWSASEVRRIGGFHYGLANLNIDASPNINAYSMWDLRWRPGCRDPRGMAYFVAGWADIYLLGVNHHVEGTSKAGATIADGLDPPKVALGYGGNGLNTYGGLSWYDANEIMSDHGKYLPTQAQFSAAAFGVTEASEHGADPVTAGHLANFTSQWGHEQIAGVIWQWGQDSGGVNAGASWQAVTDGKGSTLYESARALLGYSNFSGAVTNHGGSRAVAYNILPNVTSAGQSARGFADHLILV